MPFRRLILNAGLAAAGQLVTRFSGLVLVPLVARTLGSERLGAYQFAHVLLFYALLIVQFGLNPLFVWELARGGDRPAARFGQLLGLRLVLGLAAAAGLRLLIPISGYPSEVIGLVELLSLALLGLAVTESVDAFLQATDRLYLSGLINSLGTLCLLGGGLLALHWQAGTGGLALAYLASVGVRASIGLWLVGRLGVSVLPVGAWTTSRRLAAAGVPFFVHAVAIMLVNRLDVLVLSSLRPLQEIGFYLAAYLLLEVALYGPVAFAATVFPLQARAGSLAACRETTGRAVRLMALAVLPAAVLLVGLAPDLTRLLYGEGYTATGELLAILVWSIPLVSLAHLVGQAVTARGGQTGLARVQWLAAAANLLANLALVPRLGATGAALATVSTYALVAVGHLANAWRLGCLPDLKACLPALVAAGSSWVLASGLASGGSAVASAALTLAVYVGLAAGWYAVRVGRFGPRAVLADLLLAEARSAGPGIRVGEA